MAMDEKIENTIIDMVSNFLYYDRKEDEELPVGVIEDAVHSGVLSIDEIVAKFHLELVRGIG